MTSKLLDFAARLREFIASSIVEGREREFNSFALELFELQFARNASYRTICEAQGIGPRAVSRWSQIPTVPTAAFKEFEMTCLAPAERTRVFHSSGTTLQRPSRHFHCADSLAVYEASL